MKRSILRVGVVKSVRGRTIEVVVDKMKNVPHLLYEGTVIRNVSVGSYVKINKGFERIIGIIESEEITEDKTEGLKDYKQEKNKIVRILKLNIVGFLEGHKFHQGIKEIPLIDNVCYILTKEEYDRVHNFVNDKEDEPIILGHLSSELTKEINVGVNKLFASHIGIFGNTGSGKSYSLASIYHSLFKKFGESAGFKKRSKFLLIDFNGEYIENEQGEDVICNRSFKGIYDIPEVKVELKRKSFENIEVLSLILDATEKPQKPFIKSCLTYSKFQQRNFDPKDFIKDLIDNQLVKKDKEFGTKAFINLFNDLYDCVNEKIKILNGRSLIEEELGQYNNGSYYSISAEKGSKNQSSITSHNGKFAKENIDYYFTQPLKDIVNSLDFNNNNLLISLLLKLVLKYHFDIINGHANIEHISPLIRRAKTALTKLDKIVSIEENAEFEKNLKIVSLKNINDNSLKKILAL